MKYVLEPMLFALDENISEKDFKLYVNRLIQWDQWLEQNPEDVYMLSDTCSLLSEKYFFPIYPVFEKLMKKYKVDFVQASDLNMMINRLLTRTKKIDNACGDVIYELQQVSFLNDQDENLDSRPKTMKDAFDRLLWFIYCLSHNKKEPTEKYVLFGKNISKNFSLDIEYFTLSEKNGKLVESSPQKDHVQILCRSSLKEFFLNETTPLQILQQTTSKDDISLAVRVSVYQNGNLKKVMDSFKKYDFQIQDSFFKDFCTAHYTDNETVLNSLMEAMSHTLLNMKMGLREDFREDKGGNSKQKKSPDKTFSAWRRFVTSSIKMQYWQRANFYKFANVKEHDIFVCQWEN